MSSSRERLVLGVADGKVRVVEYSEEWPARFSALRAELIDLIGDLVEGIEHVGSTAVEGLVAKPMLDVAIGFTGRDRLDEIHQRLSRAGFSYRGDFGEEGGLIFFQGPPTARTAVLHVVEYGGRQWRNYLQFRDRLNADPEMRDRYGALKRDLAGEYSGDRDGYLAGKHDLIEDVLGASDRGEGRPSAR